jgi:hypothetical protein
MDKWFKDILPDKDPYYNRGRDQMRKRGGPEFEGLWVAFVYWNKGVNERNALYFYLLSSRKRDPTFCYCCFVRKHVSFFFFFFFFFFFRKYIYYVTIITCAHAGVAM